MHLRIWLGLQLTNHCCYDNEDNDDYSNDGYQNHP